MVHMLDDAAIDRLVISTRRQLSGMLEDVRQGRPQGVVDRADVLRTVTVALLDEVPAMKQSKIKTLIARLEILIRNLSG